MTPQEIKAGNEKIARFMGTDEDVIIRYNTHNPKIWNCNVQYHGNWDWLMPVIQKIGQTECDHEPFSDVSLYSPIELVYEAVVKFIDWYNSQNKD